MSKSLTSFWDASENEMEDSINQLVKEIVSEQKKKIVTIYEKRIDLLSQIVQWVKENEYLDYDSICYTFKNCLISAEDYSACFDLITDYLEEEHGYAVDVDCDFENKLYFLECEGITLEFFIMWGQGTFTSIKQADDEEMSGIPKKHVGSFEGWLSYIEKQHQSAIE